MCTLESMNENNITIPITDDSQYQKLLSDISQLWAQAKERAASAVNTELLETIHGFPKITNS